MKPLQVNCFVVLVLCTAVLVRAGKSKPTAFQMGSPVQPRKSFGKNSDQPVPGGRMKITDPNVLMKLEAVYRNDIEAHYNGNSTSPNYAYVSRIFSGYSQVVKGKRLAYSCVT